MRKQFFPSTEAWERFLSWMLSIPMINTQEDFIGISLQCPSLEVEGKTTMCLTFAALLRGHLIGTKYLKDSDCFHSPVTYTAIVPHISSSSVAPLIFIPLKTSEMNEIHVSFQSSWKIICFSSLFHCLLCFALSLRQAKHLVLEADNIGFHL